MAYIAPFPLHRRVGFVSRQARMMAGLSSDAADRYLKSQINQQRTTLARKGVQDDLIEQELATLERAIRAALWKEIILRPGGNRA